MPVITIQLTEKGVNSGPFYDVYWKQNCFENFPEVWTLLTGSSPAYLPELGRTASIDVPSGSGCLRLQNNNDLCDNIITQSYTSCSCESERCKGLPFYWWNGSLGELPFVTGSNPSAACLATTGSGIPFVADAAVLCDINSLCVTFASILNAYPIGQVFTFFTGSSYKLFVKDTSTTLIASGCCFPCPTTTTTTLAPTTTTLAPTTTTLAPTTTTLAPTTTTLAPTTTTLAPTTTTLAPTTTTLAPTTTTLAPTTTTTTQPCECWTVVNEDTVSINYTFTDCGGAVSSPNLIAGGVRKHCIEAGTNFIVNSPIGGLLGEYDCMQACSGSPTECPDCSPTTTTTTLAPTTTTLAPTTTTLSPTTTTLAPTTTTLAPTTTTLAPTTTTLAPTTTTLAPTTTTLSPTTTTLAPTTTTLAPTTTTLAPTTTTLAPTTTTLSPTTTTLAPTTTTLAPTTTTLAPTTTTLSPTTTTVVNKCFTLTYTTIPNDLYVRYRNTSDTTVTELIQNLETQDCGDGSYTAAICVRQGGAYATPVCVQNNIEVTCDPYTWVQGNDCTIAGTCFPDCPPTTTTLAPTTTTLAPTTTTVAPTTTTAAPTTTTEAPTTTTTTAAVASIYIDNNNSLDVPITDMTINGVSVTYVSGQNFTINAGNNGNFETTQLGTQTVIIYYGGHIAGQNIVFTDSDNNITCKDLNGAAGSFTIPSSVITGGTTIYVTVSDGACF